MFFKMTNHIAFETNRRAEAERFYNEVLGMKQTKKQTEFTEFSNGATSFFVADLENCPGLMLDFEVENVSVAVEYLIKNECEIIKRNDQSQICFVKDPFGLVFNLTEKK